ncbi:MAG: hypothetical protein LAP87_30180 [Acidobacteriia bacterium]|nr:hypothetical protein [Terriglobia bacterium]
MSNQSRFCRTSLLGFACLAVLGATPADEIRLPISGPYTHENLSVFLIHGKTRQEAKSYLTLQEAMQQKKVVVYETGSVNELAVENQSGEDVYIQSGDIVKGGRQDRVLTDDYVLPARSGRVPVASFCVEHGRWTKRGAEAADRFGSSDKALAGKQLKMAARTPHAQAEVWNQVAAVEARMADGVAAGVAGAAPPPPAAIVPASGSMQLTLENKDVAAATDAYVRDLAKIADARKDVVGYAFAINGKVNSADIYASADLFRRMWPKLLHASAAEALAERQNGKTYPAVDVSAVRDAMAQAEGGRESSRQVGKLVVVRKDAGTALLFETRDGEGGAWLHKSYVVK